MGACFSNFCLLCLPGIWLRGPGVSLPWACQPSPQTGGLPAWKGEGSCPGRPMPCHWATGSRRQTRGLPSPLAHEPRALRAQGRGSLGPSRGSALAEPRARLDPPANPASGLDQAHPALGTASRLRPIGRPTLAPDGRVACLEGRGEGWI